MSQFNLDDIEEVETRPKKRKHIHNHRHINEHNHNHSLEHNNNNNNIQEHNHTHTHEHVHNHSHNHRRRRVVFIEKLGCTQYLLMILFSLCLFLLFFSFFANVIIAVKQIIVPRIFMPSIILFIFSFMFSGGILGTYMQPPQGAQLLRPGERYLLRYFTPFIMLIITIIFFFFSLNNLKLLKNDIKYAEKICESNKGLTMEGIYNKYNKTIHELEQEKYNVIYLFNRNLVCYPQNKCIKLSNEENNYICNIDISTKNGDNNDIDLPDTKCDEIFFDILSIYTLDKEKDANLFINNCKEINEKELFEKRLNIFKCESKKNLDINKLIQNKNININTNVEDKYKSNIDKYYNNKINEYENEIKKKKEMMTIYDNSNYSYHSECYKSVDYSLIYFLINAYCTCYYCCSLCWVFLGIQGAYKLLTFIKNDFTGNELNDSNNFKNGDNKLMMNNSEQYMELPTQYS